MTTPNDIDDALGAMDEYGDLWRSQEAGTPDFTQLRRDATRARRREIALTVLEVAAFALAVGVGARFVEHRGWGPATYVVIASLALAAAFIAWTIWNRRAQLRRSPLSPADLIDREVRRVHAARRFWRVNTRVMLVLLASVVLLALAKAFGWIGGTFHPCWWGPVLFNLPLAAVSVVWARRRDAALRERLHILEALRRQLGD